MATSNPRQTAKDAEAFLQAGQHRHSNGRFKKHDGVTTEPSGAGEKWLDDALASATEDKTTPRTRV